MIFFMRLHLPGLTGKYSCCGNRKHVNTCSPVCSSTSGWNVNKGCAWFSLSHTAFNCKLTSEYGRYCKRLPDTSSTCKREQFPNSVGNRTSLLSRKLKTPKLAQLPISEGMEVSELRSTLKLLKRVMRPSECGNSTRKFSVRINSCMFSHLFHKLSDFCYY